MSDGLWICGGYKDRSGVYHKSYCRKLKRIGFGGPEAKYEKMRKKSEDDSKKQAVKIIAESDSNPEPAGFSRKKEYEEKISL